MLASKLKSAHQFKAVLFDMDGLMIDTESISILAWQKAGSECSLTISRELCLRLMGTTEEDADDILKSELGKEIPIHHLRNLWRSEILNTINSNGIKKLDGLDDLINFIDSIGLIRAIATSSSRKMATLKLDASGLTNVFKTVVTGDDVLRGKPNPDLFLEASNQINVKPEDCLVLEDSEQGIMAAKNAGMKSIMIPGVKPATKDIQTIATAILPSLRTVCDFLSQKT